MSFRVTAGVWLGTVCGLSLANKLLFFKVCEAGTGQAAQGLFIPWSCWAGGGIPLWL